MTGITNSRLAPNEPVEEIIDKQIGIVLNTELSKTLGNGGIENGGD